MSGLSEPFMYSGNHPRGFVLADIALEACKRAGLTSQEEFVWYDQLVDLLQASHELPFFPELARSLGYEGSRDFKIAGRAGDRFMPLEQYVYECFERYGSSDRSGWSIPERTRKSAQLMSNWK